MVEDHNYWKWQPVLDHLELMDETKREWLVSLLERLENNTVVDLTVKKLSFEDRLKIGYQEYLKLPLAEITTYNENELYKNGWYTRIGLGVVSPDPHKHYSFLVFVFECGRKESLYERFIKSQYGKVDLDKV
jgi:hypothetical protein